MLSVLKKLFVVKFKSMSAAILPRSYTQGTVWNSPVTKFEDR